jgi:ketosteroid isomerase-like protein
MSAENKKIVEKVNEAFARGDVEAFLAHCSDDFIWTMVGEKPVVGKEATRQFMASVPADPPKFSVDRVVAEGDFVVAQGDMTMKEGDKVVPYTYCDFWRLRGGKLVELRAFVIKTDRTTSAV